MDAGDARTIRELADAARHVGLNDTGYYIEDLFIPVDNDFEPTSLDSVRWLVSFLVKHCPGMPVPIEVWIDPNGHAGCTWEFAENVDLKVCFLPSGNVRFGYRDKIHNGCYKPRKKEIMTPDEMLKSIANLPAGSRPDWDMRGGGGGK